MSEHISVLIDDPLFKRIENIVDTQNEWDNRSQFVRYCLREGVDGLDDLEAQPAASGYGSRRY